MNKKLLGSTALIGAALISSTAMAEFKVGGDITATYIFGGADAASSTSSDNRIGNETNLKMSGSADLSNGWKAVYTGKAEFDGAATANPDHEYELQLQNGGMYVSFANDGGQTNKTMLTPFVSYPTSSSANAITPTKSAFAADTQIIGVAESNNIGVGGKAAGGSWVVRYAPHAAASGSDGNDIDNITAEGGSGSGYLIAYSGTSGAMSVAAAYTVLSANQASASGVSDAKEKRIGVAYNFGKAKVGADYIDYTSGEDTIGTNDKKTILVGAAFSLNDQVTVGVYHQSTSDEKNGATTQDEDVRMISLGYNLGAGSVAVNVVDVEGASNGTTMCAAATNCDYQGILVTTKVGF